MQSAAPKAAKEIKEVAKEPDSKDILKEKYTAPTKEQEESAVKIQKVYRGHKDRKELKDTKGKISKKIYN